MAGLIVPRRCLIKGDRLTVELDIDVAGAVGGQAFEAGVKDKLAAVVDGAVCVDVREVVLGRDALRAPVPVSGRLAAVLGTARGEDGVVDSASRRDVVFGEAGGKAAMEVDYVSAGVEDRAPVGPGRRVVHDVALEFEIAAGVHGKSAGNDDQAGDENEYGEISAPG